MRDDDQTVGRVLSRREVVGLLGLSGVALLVDPLTGQAVQRESGVAPCVVQPQQTEGPYFVDGMLNRPDIRTEPPTGPAKPGVPLTVTFNVMSMAAGGACTPLAGAHVDLWQCDALGVYSGREGRQLRYRRPEIPARLPADRREGRGEVHDDLSRLVPGARRPHPFQDPHESRRRERPASSPRSCTSTKR